MMTGVLAARNIARSETNDVWSVNTERSYHEGAAVTTGDRLIPTAVPSVEREFPEAAFSRAFARLDAVALGTATGLTAGVLIFLATVILLLKGGEVVGPNLSLLSQYFLGYEVTWVGAVVGFVEAGVLGFMVGHMFAIIRNFALKTYLTSIRRRVELKENPDILESV